MPDDVREALRKSDEQICEFFRHSKYSMAYQMANGTAPEHLASRVKNGKLRVYQGSRGVVSLVQSSSMYAKNRYLRDYPTADRIRHLTEEVIGQFSEDGKVDDKKLEGHFLRHQSRWWPHANLTSLTFTQKVAEGMAGKPTPDHNWDHDFLDVNLGIVNEVLVPVERVLIPPSCVDGEDEVFAVLFAEVDTNYVNLPIESYDSMHDDLIPEIGDIYFLKRWEAKNRPFPK